MHKVKIKNADDQTVSIPIRIVSDNTYLRTRAKFIKRCLRYRLPYEEIGEYLGLTKGGVGYLVSQSSIKIKSRCRICNVIVKPSKSFCRFCQKAITDLRDSPVDNSHLTSVKHSAILNP